MKYMDNNLKEKLKENKILILGIVFVIVLIGYIAIPTFSQENTTTLTNTITVWDGTIATSYKDGDGTIDNPYVISNGSELAYFKSQLESTSYEGEYFILSNDIVLNDGIFSYTKDTGIKYTKDTTENTITPNTETDIINKFGNLNNFKGNFDGDNYTIYGLYIDEPVDKQNALFTNLEGNISNLYLKNSLIYGGKITAGIASKTKNSTLTNISYNGFVVSDEETESDTISIELEDITKTTTNELTETITINNTNYIPGIISAITLSGTYDNYGNSNVVLKINDETINAGEFNITLDNNLESTITINYTTTSESNFSLTDLKYEITYNYSNAAGIVSIAENTTFKNVINKANINASIYASGIINTVTGITTIENVYNSGTIESTDTSSGLISSINQNIENVTINNSYNSGSLISENSAMIGNIKNNTGTITLTNTFNTQDTYAINLIESSNVTINNSYIISDKNIKTGTISEEFTETTLENLKTKNFVQTELNYQEYNETENIENNVWVWQFDTDSLPILYIDELNEPIANIYISENSWNNYKTELETLKFSEKIVFSIEPINELSPIKEIYYHISNEKTALTKEELNAIDTWIKYEDIDEITEEGFYVINAKIIDNNNNEIYLNSDLLILDLTGSEITISSTSIDNSWSDFKTELINYYIDKEINVDIQAEDSLSGINKIYYYISETILTLEEVKNIDTWTEFSDAITITSKKNIIYVKVIDNCNYATYANTDLIILDGYTLNSLSAGMDGETTDNLYITNNSSVSLSFTYQDTSEYIESNKHQIISNKLLPENTKITLIDINKNKVYSYITTESDYGYNDCNSDNCEATYDFELFTEISSTNTLFKENDYTEEINEEFIITLDFANTEITENIENVKISLRLDSENTNEIRNTLQNSIKNFSIISENSQATFTLTSSFQDTIKYNENKTYTIDFQTKLNYKTFEDNKIFDTTYDDKYLGLSIKMVNSDGNITSKQNLKNISFKIGDKKYAPSADGIVRINLEKEISDIEGELTIQTYSDNSTLEDGNYNFIISLYAAFDGMYSNESLASIEIPVYVGANAYNNDNNFNVIMNDEDKIIETKANEFNFNLLVDDIKENTNIKISLYKKVSLSAYDQNYTIIDLGEYIIDNQLEKYDDFIYYASKELTNNNELKINIDTSLLEKRGYMFVFELYEDETLVNTIRKKFIVK